MDWGPGQAVCSRQTGPHLSTQCLALQEEHELDFSNNLALLLDTFVQGTTYAPVSSSLRQRPLGIWRAIKLCQGAGEGARLVELHAFDLLTPLPLCPSLYSTS